MFQGPSETTPGAICASFAVTIADAMAWDRAWTRSAEARRLMARLAVAGLAAAGVFAFGTLLAVRAVLAGGGCDLDETFSSNARLQMLLVTGASIVALETVAAAIFVWRRQRSLEAVYRARRLKRPGVDAADPDLAEHFTCAVDATGFRFDNKILDMGLLWTGLARLEETADYMFFVTGIARAYIVPKRELPPGVILAIRDLARAAGKLADPSTPRR